MTAVAPASAAASKPSAKGKNASEATAEPTVNGSASPAVSAASWALRAAMRAPDHGRLRPWRFVVIAGDRRELLGQCFRDSLVIRGVSDDAQLTKALNAPLRAPLVLAGLLHPVAHEKISRDEQGHAVAAALHAAQLAADALGYGCVWRTGGYATDPNVVEALGGDVGDEVIGFLYLGTREGPSKLLPEEPLESFVRYF